MKTKVTIVKGASSVCGTFQNLWCFTWKTKKQYEKWEKFCIEHYRGYFLKFENQEFTY